MQQFGPKLLVGDVASLIPVKKETAVVAKPAAGSLLSGDNEVFGDLAPFCEPSWFVFAFAPEVFFLNDIR